MGRIISAEEVDLAANEVAAAEAAFLRSNTNEALGDVVEARTHLERLLVARHNLFEDDYSAAL